MNGGTMDAFRVGQPISAVPSFDSFDSCVPAESELRMCEGWTKSDRHPHVIPRGGYLWTLRNKIDMLPGSVKENEYDSLRLTSISPTSEEDMCEFEEYEKSLSTQQQDEMSKCLAALRISTRLPES